MESKPGFLAYTDKHLKKVNSLRLTNSLVNISSTPILDKGQVCYSEPSDSGNKPRSCYNCHFYNSRGKTCQLLGPNIRVEKFIYPSTTSQESKPIEYWPVCGMWDNGTPKDGVVSYKQTPYDNPDNVGYGWVNAPEIGLKLSGTSCGGANGGDDCDNYIISTDDKREAKTGFCRVLQTDVPNMACCTAWQDDDYVNWQEGTKILEELDKERSKYNPSPNPLLK